MSGFIKYLRSFVGKAPLIQCCASVIVYRGDSLLLQKRSDDGTWGYAGGSIELGETAEEAAKRELFEETGLIANELKLLNVFSGQALHHIYPNGDEVYSVDIVYTCSDFKGNMVSKTDETDDLRWFHIDKLPESICPPAFLALNTFISILRDNNNVVHK